MSLSNDRHSKWTLAVMIAVLVAATLFSMFLYQNAAVKRIQNRVCNTLQIEALEEREAFLASLDWKYKMLETVAQGLAQEETGELEPLMEKIKAVAGNADYLYPYLAYPDGTSYTENGAINIADRGYFQRSMQGGRGLEMVTSRIDGEPRFMISVPVEVDGDVRYVLYAYCENELLSEMLCIGSDITDGYALICTKDGSRILGGSVSDDITMRGNFLSEIETGMDAADFAQVCDDFTSEKSGIASYKENGAAGMGTYFAYVPLGMNGWMICLIVPAENMSEEIMQTVQSGYLIIAAIMIISAAFVLLFAYIIRQNSRRILHDQALLNESNARYRMAIESTSVAVWDYDILKRRFTFDERSMRLIGANGLVIDDAVETLIAKGFVHEESIKDMRELHERLAAGEKNPDAVIRMRSIHGSEWMYEHIRYTNLFDEKGVPYLAIGMGEDVTAEYVGKRRINELSAAVECDSMTGLLNHAATFEHIKRYLTGEGACGVHALFMIDIDDFKQVNDIHGHQMGDYMIHQIACEIEKTFRGSDIVGRVGGDEFMVFMKDVPDLSYVKKKALELIKELHFPCRTDSQTTDASASVGVAVCHGNSRSFEEIYAEADSALYRAKGAGKSCYEIVE